MGITVRIMKKFFRIFITCCSVFVAGLFIIACSNSEDLLEERVNTKSDKFTMTVNATKGSIEDMTRALQLSGDGKTINATWSATNNEKVFVKAADGWFEGSLTPQTDGASAKLKGTISGQAVSAGDKITLLFPRKEIDFTGQDGTLETIAQKYDYATAQDIEVLSVENGTITTADATFYNNKQNIVKFTLIDKSTGAPINATHLTITEKNTGNGDPSDALALTRDGSTVLSSGDLELTLNGSTNVVYTAISYISSPYGPPRMTLTATYGGNTYMYVNNNITFSNAARYYDVTVKMLKYPIELSAVTSDYVGSVIGSDGKVYIDVVSALAAGTKASAIIAYVGNDTGDADYKHGLAIAMKDASGGTQWGGSSNYNDNPAAYSTIAEALAAKESGRALSSERNTDSWPSFKTAYNNSIDCVNYGDKPSSGCSEWFLPSIFQWNQIARGLTGETADFTDSANDDYKADNVNKKILRALSALLQSSGHQFENNSTYKYLASSSEKTSSYIWVYDIYDGNAYSVSKSSAWPRVRAVFAF